MYSGSVSVPRADLRVAADLAVAVRVFCGEQLDQWRRVGRGRSLDVSDDAQVARVGRRDMAECGGHGESSRTSTGVGGRKSTRAQRCFHSHRTVTRPTRLPHARKGRQRQLQTTVDILDSLALSPLASPAFHHLISETTTAPHSPTTTGAQDGPARAVCPTSERTRVNSTRTAGRARRPG